MGAYSITTGSGSVLVLRAAPRIVLEEALLDRALHVAAQEQNADHYRGGEARCESTIDAMKITLFVVGVFGLGGGIVAIAGGGAFGRAGATQRGQRHGFCRIFGGGVSAWGAI